jgi:signal transduction histidine kinase
MPELSRSIESVASGVASPQSGWLSPPAKRLVEHYTVAVATTVLGAAGREALTPILGSSRGAYLTFYMAVVLSSWIGGVGPGLCTTVLSTATALYFWRMADWAAHGVEARDWVGLIFFVISGIAISLGNESLRRSYVREKQARAEAQAARAEAEAALAQAEAARAQAEAARAQAEAARAQAEAAVLAREELQAIVAHDLRTPLGTIAMQAAMLQKSAPPSVDGEAYDVRRRAELMLRATSHMSDLIRDLLDAASIDAGRLSVSAAPDDARATLGAAVELAGPVAQAKGVMLEQVPCDSIPVRWDRQRILQLFGNLLGNAIKFTPEGGRVRVQIAGEGDRLRISVEDTGPGIPADHRAHVFERFWKGKRGAGTGLGLFIASGIAKAHGGTLDVVSEPGSGSTFTLSLPR